MQPGLILSRIGKYHRILKELNRSEGWGLLKSCYTYFDYVGAFVMHGCLIDQYVNGRFYSFRGFQRKRIITQRRLEKIINSVNSPDHIHLLENKTHFNLHFKDWVKRHWVDSETMSIEDFTDICKDGKCLFIKPLDACEGKGISKICSPATESEINRLYQELKSGHFIIEQELTQHTEMIFGNKSVNTLRINTLLDNNGKVHIFKPVLRAGIGDAYVDNYNAGGVEYAVDLESGVIMMPGYCKGEMNQIYHPGTDIKMVGYKIPLWDDVIESVTKAARLIPECRYVGWDVAITPNGIELIEGNHNPGYVCMEYFGETGWYAKLKEYL